MSGLTLNRPADLNPNKEFIQQEFMSLIKKLQDSRASYERAADYVENRKLSGLCLKMELKRILWLSPLQIHTSKSKVPGSQRGYGWVWLESKNTALSDKDVLDLLIKQDSAIAENYQKLLAYAEKLTPELRQKLALQYLACLKDLKSLETFSLP